MAWLKSILHEAYGLFVDDGSFAVAILLWLGVNWQVLPRLGLPPAWGGPILFAGLALILLESAVRARPALGDNRLSIPCSMRP